MFWLKGRGQKSSVDTLIIIGAHRDELAFGDKVVEVLDRDQVAVLRIPQGIVGDRPRPDQAAAFTRRHQDLYRQILDHIEPQHRLVIDVHCGLGGTARTADVFCHWLEMLSCLETGTASRGSLGTVRGVRLVASTTFDDGADPFPSRPIATSPISEALWRNRNPVYVGLEVYLAEQGAGAPKDWEFARALIADMRICRRELAQQGRSDIRPATNGHKDRGITLHR